MPRRYFYHDTVKNALIKNGWTITDDPLELVVGFSRLQVNLGGGKVEPAEKVAIKIAAEINELEKAMGQYALYQQLMKTRFPDRRLYLAVEDEAYVWVFCDEIGRLALQAIPMNLIVFNASQEAITQWIESGSTEKQ